MIKKPTNYDSASAPSERRKLPAGGYVCKIRTASVEDAVRLVISFDISEGEYKDFFMSEYNSSTIDGKKYKGFMRFWLPLNDNTEKDNWTVSILKGFVTAVESSNGIAWDWNERTLAGKTVGILFRNEEWEYEGKTGWSAKAFRAVDANRIRSGNYTVPKEKPLVRSESYDTGYSASSASFAVDESDGFLPF